MDIRDLFNPHTIPWNSLSPFLFSILYDNVIFNQILFFFLQRDDVTAFIIPCHNITNKVTQNENTYFTYFSRSCQAHEAKRRERKKSTFESLARIFCVGNRQNRKKKKKKKKKTENVGTDTIATGQTWNRWHVNWHRHTACHTQHTWCHLVDITAKGNGILFIPRNDPGS